MAWTLTIGGVDRTDWLYLPSTGGSIAYDLATRSPGSLRVRIYDVAGGVISRPAIGTALTLAESVSGFAVGGHIIDVRAVDFTDLAAGRLVDLIVEDYNALPAQVMYSASYPAGTTLEDIIDDLIVGKLGACGIAKHPSQAAGPALTSPLSFVDTYCDEILNRLQLLFGWVWRVDASILLRYIQPGSVSSGVSLDATTGTLQGAPTRRNSRASGYGNTVIYTYGSGRRSESDSFVASGSAAPGGVETYETTYPASQDINDPWPNQLILNGSPAGVVSWGDQRPTFSAWWEYTEHTLKIDQALAGVTAGGTTVDIAYTAQFPAKVTVEDVVALAADGHPIELKPEPDEDTDNIDSATDAATAVLRRAQGLGETMVSVEHRAGEAYPGETIDVDYPNQDLSGSLMVVSMSLRDDVDGAIVFTHSLIDSDEQPDTWLDAFRSTGGATGSGGVVSGGVGGVVTTVASGSGTPGNLAAWATSGTLGDTNLNYTGETLTNVGNAPAYGWYEQDAALNAKAWLATASGASWLLQKANDDGSGVTTLVAVNRSGELTTGIWKATAVGAQWGGTGINTAASTGVPSIAAGTWSVAAQLAAAKGGTGIDTSGSTGVAKVASGTWSVATIVNADVSGSAAIAWTKIDKSGSSLADLTTRSAGDLSSGNLAYARMPSGSGTWSATPTISGALTLSSTLSVNASITTPAATNLTLNPTGDLVLAPTGADVLPNSGYTVNLGALTNKYLTLHAAELWVETLVAQNTLATIGGRVLVAPTNLLTADLSAVATTIQVKYNNLANGDRIYLEANGQLEWMAVTSSASGSAGAYTYTVTRNLDGSGANSWTAGDAILNTGTTGKGFIDLCSVSGVLSGSGPTIVGNVRTGTTYSDIAPRWAIGNLNGLYGYGAETYGAGFGDASGANIVIDPTNGIRIRQSTTVYAVMASSTFRLGASGGKRVEWDGTNLTVVGDYVTINTSGITVAASTAASYVSTNAYKFSSGVTSSNFGLFGGDDTSVGGTYGTYMRLTTVNDKNIGGGGFANATVNISAEAVDPQTTARLLMTAGGAWHAGTASATLTAGSLSLTLTSSSLTSTAPLSVTTTALIGASGAPSYGSFGVQVTSAAAFTAYMNNASSTGSGLLIDAGSSSSEAAFYLRNYNASVALFQVTGAGQIYSWSSSGLGGVITWPGSGTGGYWRFDLGSPASQLAYAGSSNQVIGVGSSTDFCIYTANLRLAAGGGQEIVLYNGTTARIKMDGNGDWIPATNNTQNVGVPTQKFSLVRATTITSGDLTFENDWAFTEAEKVGIAEPGIVLLDDTGEPVAFFGKTGFRFKGGNGPFDIDTLAHVRTTLAQRSGMDRHPEQRIVGYTDGGRPVYGTRALVPFPDPATGKSNAQRRIA